MTRETTARRMGKRKERAATFYFVVRPPHSPRVCASRSLQSLNYFGREKKGTACSLLIRGLWFFFRDELSSQTQALHEMDKQVTELANKLKQEQNSAQAAQRDLQGKLDKSMHDCEKIRQQLNDMKTECSSKEQALNAQKQSIAELNQELKVLKQDKSNVLAEMDRDSQGRKKIEEQLAKAQTELQMREDLLKNAQNAIKEQAAEFDKIRKQSHCDAENLRALQQKLEAENDALKKQVKGSESLVERKERELYELGLKFEEHERNAQKLCRQIDELKVRETQQNEAVSALQAQLQKANSLVERKNDEERLRSAKFAELEQHGGELEKELGEARFKSEEMEKCVADLKTQRENAQQLAERRNSELEALKESIGEMDNSRKLENAGLSEKLVEAEGKHQEEVRKCGELRAELAKAKAELEQSVSAASEAKALLDQTQATIQQKEADNLRKIEELNELGRGKDDALAVVEREMRSLKSERETSEQEHQKLLQQKADECAAALENLERSQLECAKLKEGHVQFQNVVACKDQEKAKLEASYQELCEQFGEKEQCFNQRCAELEKEKGELVERERDARAVAESAKCDIRALQHDYRKVCELADAKSAEYRDMVDKLGLSQKYGQELRQQLTQAENKLRADGEKLSELATLKESLSEELAQREEELQNAKHELGQLKSEDQEKFAKFEENLTTLRGKLDEAAEVVSKKTSEADEISAKFDEVQVKLEAAQDTIKELDEKGVNWKVALQQKDCQIEGLLGELNTVETAASELAQKLKEKDAILNQSEASLNKLEAQREEDLKLLKAKEDELAGLVNELEKLQATGEEEASAVNAMLQEVRAENCKLDQKCSQLEARLQRKEDELRSSISDLEASSQEIIEIQKLIQTKENAIVNLEEAKASLGIKSEEMRQALLAKDSELQEKRRELDEIQRSFDERENARANEARESGERADVMRAQLEMQEQALQEKSADISRAQELLQQKELEVSELQKKLVETEDCRSEASRQLAELTLRLTGLEEAVKQRSLELEAKQKAIDDLQDVLSTRSRDDELKVQDLTEKLADAQTKLERGAGVLEAKEQELSVVALQRDELLGKLQGHEERTNASEAGVANLEKEKQELSLQLEQISAALQSKDEELTSAKMRLETIAEEVDTKFTKEKEEAELQQQELNRLAAELGQAKELVDTKEAQIKCLQETVRNFEEEAGNVALKLEGLEFSRATLQEDLEDNKVKFEQLREALESKETALSAANAAVEDLTRSLEATRQTEDSKITQLHEKLSGYESELERERCLLQEKERESALSSAALEEARKECADLKELLDTRDSSLRGFEESAEATRSEKERLASLLEAKEKDLLVRSQVCDALKKEKDDLGEQFEELSGRLAKASESVEQLEREKCRLEELAHKTQAQVLQRSAEEERTRAQGQEDFERVQAKLENEEKAKQLLQSENDDLQNRLSHKSKELDAAKLQIDQLEKDFSELSAHKEMLQMDFDDNDTYISSLEEKVGNLEGAKTQMEQKLSAREEAFGALKTELEETVTRLQAAGSRDDMRKVDEDELKRKLQNLEVQLEAAKEAKTSYGDEVAELQKRCNELSKALEGRDKELGEAKESGETQKSRADDAKACLQQKLTVVQSERDQLAKKCDELSCAQSALLERVEKLALELAAANSETESSASSFRLTIESLKLAKEGLEKELSESQRVLSCAAQLDEENRTKLEELRKSTALKQENYSLTEQKLQEEASKVDSLEQELKDAASKLRATEEALEAAEAKAEGLSNGKSLSEGMLTAVHARLQSCEKAMVEKDAAVIELEETLSRRDEELQKLSGLKDTRQSQLTEMENSLRSAQEARAHAEKKADEERAWITQDFSQREQEMRDLLEDEKQTSSSLEEEIGRLKDELRELTAQKVSAIDQEKEMVRISRSLFELRLPACTRFKRAMVASWEGEPVSSFLPNLRRVEGLV